LNHFTVPCTSCLLWQVTSYSWGGSETKRRHEHELRASVSKSFSESILLDRKIFDLCIFRQKSIQLTLSEVLSGKHFLFTQETKCCLLANLTKLK
jgi:hypothetical protein